MKKCTVLILFITISLLTIAQTVFPQYEFRSTSVYPQMTVQRQYTIPIAAYELKNPNSHTIRKVKYEDSPGYDQSDPGWEHDTPVGDMIVPLFMLSVVYILVKRYKENTTN